MTDEEIRRRQGRAVRVLRQKRGMSQAEFAREVMRNRKPIGPKIVSKIENGDQWIDREQRGEIERYFQVKLDDLADDVVLEDDHVVRLLTDAEYFELHEKFIDDEHEAGVEVWFFNPSQDLPVLHDAHVKDIWKENIRLKVEMRLVWPVNGAEVTALDQFNDRAREILRLARDGHGDEIGKIAFHACGVTPESKSEMKQRYQEIAESLGHHPVTGLEVLPIRFSETEPHLHRVFNLPTSILNRSRKPDGRRYAAIHLDGVGSDAWGDHFSSGWIFCEPRQRVRLERLAEHFLKSSTAPCSEGLHPAH